MANLAYNERIKFTAKALSNLGIVCIIAGILGPVLVAMREQSADLPLLAVIAWAAGGVVSGVVLNLAALWFLARLR
jgi:hypothetical protein